MDVLNFKLIGRMVCQPELFNILNLGSGIEIKLGTSMYNDVLMWAEAYRVASKCPSSFYFVFVIYFLY